LKRLSISNVAGRGNSFDIMTALRARLPAGTGAHTYTGAHTASGGCGLRRMIYIHLVPRLRKSGAISQYPNAPSWRAPGRIVKFRQVRSAGCSDARVRGQTTADRCHSHDDMTPRLHKHIQHSLLSTKLLFMLYQKFSLISLVFALPRTETIFKVRLKAVQPVTRF
jgi:hypothetical protein